MELAALTSLKKDICTRVIVSAFVLVPAPGWMLARPVQRLVELCSSTALHCPGHRHTPQGCKEGGDSHPSVLWGSLSCSHLSWDLASSSIISISFWSLWYLCYSDRKEGSKRSPHPPLLGENSSMFYITKCGSSIKTSISPRNSPTYTPSP